jgi:hypothetical protein
MRCSNVCRAPVLRGVVPSYGIAGSRRSRLPTARFWTDGDLLVAARCNEYVRDDGPRTSRNDRGLYMVSRLDRTRYTRQIGMTTACGVGDLVARTCECLRVDNSVYTSRARRGALLSSHTLDTSRAIETSVNRAPSVRCGCPDAECCLPDGGFLNGCPSCRRLRGECEGLRELPRTQPARQHDAQMPESHRGAIGVHSLACRRADRRASGDCLPRRAASCTQSTVAPSLMLSVAAHTGHREIAPAPPHNYTVTGVMA